MTDPEARLIEPTESMEAAYRDLLADFAAAGEAEIHGNGETAGEDFAALVRRLRDHAAGRGLEAGWVPASTFWLVAGGDVLGTCNIRHRLAERLLDFGGHIGYSIRPSRRGRGFGRLILKLALREARKLGVRRALVTCDSDNVRSARVIEANGGALDSESFSEGAGRVTRRYWIDLPPDDAAAAADIRPCGDADFEDIFQIVNAAAQKYRGVIPADRWQEPYMPREELAAEVAAGVAFWGEWRDGRLVGVMGIQPVGEVSLIRHAYVRPECQGAGVGSRLIRHLQSLADRPLLVGTWSAATWAVRFYEKHGFCLVTPDQKNMLLRKYWSIPPRQVETSVVLADARWLAGAAADAPPEPAS